MTHMSVIVHDIAAKSEAPGQFLGNNRKPNQLPHVITLTAASKVNHLLRRPFTAQTDINRQQYLIIGNNPLTGTKNPLDS